MPASVIAFYFRSAVTALAALCVAGAVSAAELPRVASINLCADQLVLSLADAEQIVTVSWLAADPEESLFATEARRHPLNYGSAEELLRFAPDVVIAGAYTNAFTRALLARLGHSVVELEPEISIDDIERNVRIVAAAVRQPARGDALVARMHSELRRLDAAKPRRAPAAVVVRPGSRRPAQPHSTRMHPPHSARRRPRCCRAGARSAVPAAALRRAAARGRTPAPTTT
jgi:iron complex transport system substrate-binding protein